jgi:PAS domain S-box-containing protein
MSHISAAFLSSMQLELAMALSESLDLETMLRGVVKTLLRRLDCLGVAVYSVAPQVDAKPRTVVSLPRSHAPRLDDALEQFAVGVHGSGPSYGAVTDETSTRHLFVLPGWGILKLRHQSEVLDPMLQRSIQSITRRIAVAAAASSAYAALRDSEARQHGIVESSLDGIVTINDQGLVLAFNAAAETIFGYRREQILGRPMHDFLMPAHHRSAHVAGMANYLKTGHGPVLNRRIVVEGQRANGEVFPMELAVVPSLTASGEEFTATVRDVSELQRVQRELRENVALAQAAFEQVAVGVMHQAQDRRFVRVNQTLCKMLGYTAEQFLALDADYLIHPEDVAPGLEGMQRLFKGEIQNFTHEKRYRKSSGEWLWVRLTSSLLRGVGDELLMIGVVEDVSLRHRAEAVANQARKRELQIASQIQDSLLVQGELPNVSGLQLSSFNTASQSIDGDFVEVLRVGPDCVDVVAGDVMGKGLGAALLGAATKLQISRSIVELLTLQGRRRSDGRLPSPAEVVTALHVALTPALQRLDAFVTLCYLRIDRSRDLLTWVGCGHEETVLSGTSGPALTLPNQHPPLGVLVEQRFEQEDRRFAMGEWLFLSSDGLTDAIGADGERVGRDKVVEAFHRYAHRHATAGAVIHAMRRDLLGSGVTLTDDLTMVTVGCQPPSTARLELALSLTQIGRLRQFLTQEFGRTRLSADVSGLLLVAAVEAFTNVVRHGKGLLPGARAEVQVERSSDQVSINLIHCGDAFNPKDTRGNTDLSEYPEGGFGLQIIHGVCDEVRYDVCDGVNTLRMVKHIG